MLARSLAHSRASGADTLGASAFTWSACCTSRSRRARLIYGGRINYKEQIEKSVNRLRRTVSAIICRFPLPPRPLPASRDRLSRPGPIEIFARRFEFRVSERRDCTSRMYLLPFFSRWHRNYRITQLKLVFYERGSRLPAIRAVFANYTSIIFSFARRGNLRIDICINAHVSMIERQFSWFACV